MVSWQLKSVSNELNAEIVVDLDSDSSVKEVVTRLLAETTLDSAQTVLTVGDPETSVVVMVVISSQLESIDDERTLGYAVEPEVGVD